MAARLVRLRKPADRATRTLRSRASLPPPHQARGAWARGRFRETPSSSHGVSPGLQSIVQANRRSSASFSAPAPWRRISATVQASTAGVESMLRLEADHAVQAADRLEVFPHPGQTQSPVVPGRRIGWIGRRQSPKQVGRRIQVLVALVAQAIIPDCELRRVGGLAESIRCPGRQGQVGCGFEGCERLPSRDRIRIGLAARAARSPRRPAGAGSSNDSSLREPGPSMIPSVSSLTRAEIPQFDRGLVSRKIRGSRDNLRVSSYRRCRYCQSI